MKRISTSEFLNNTVKLLIMHFGVEAVRSSLERAADIPAISASRITSRKSSPSESKQAATPITVVLAMLQKEDVAKYELLEDFYTRLKRGTILPDSEDIRYFARVIGVKNIEGRSRKDVIPRLINLLIDIPIDRLRPAIKEAEGISELQRKRGFSVLTDKLMGEK